MSFSFSACFVLFPVVLSINLLLPQKALPFPKTHAPLRRKNDLIEIGVHVMLICASGVQTCLGMILSTEDDGSDWYSNPSFVLSYCTTTLLLCTDLVSKCRFISSPTYRSTLTYLICLAEELTSIFISATCLRGPFKSSVFDAAQFSLTLGKMAVLVTISARNIACLTNARFQAVKAGRDVSDDYLGQNYGTIPSSSMENDASKKQASSLPENPPHSEFWRLFQYIWPSNLPKLRILVVSCFLLEVTQRCINVLVPRALGIATGELQSGRSPFKQIFLFALYRACSGKTGLIGSLRSQLWIPIGQNTYRQITLSAFEWVMNLSLDFHLTRRLGVVTSALTKGAAVDLFLDFLLFSLIGTIADILLAVAYFFVYFDFSYAIIVLVMSWMYLSATIYMALYRGTARRRMVDYSQIVNAVQTDAIMTYEAVHLNSALELEMRKLGTSIEQYLSGEFVVLASLNVLNALQSLIFSLGLLAVAMLCAYRIRQGTMVLADFVTVVTYMIQLQGPLGFLGSVYNMVQNSLIDAEKILSLFEQTATVTEKTNAVDLGNCHGSVTFSNVSFSYTPGHPAIKNFSLKIPAGQSLAIVGESGSGKSTLFRLLLRFYDVDQGSISIDGTDIRDVTLKSLRAQFGVVPQETTLYNDTLMYNVLYANADAEQEAVHQACKAAQIHGKIESLPQKYDTIVGERGLKLSGGERQRVAIARVVLRAPSIVMLDEATSSLDYATEKQIQASFEMICRNRTSITIAHRLSTIANCDMIVVLHKGEMVEKGSHAELLAKKGMYYTMWNKQTRTDSEDSK